MYLCLNENDIIIGRLLAYSLIEEPWTLNPMAREHNLLGLPTFGVLEESGCPRFPVTEQIMGSNPIHLARKVLWKMG